MSDQKRSVWGRNRKATEEEKSRKRAAEQARRLGPGQLNDKEEEFANHVRTQLANISGYFYRPDYQYAHLRTELPCEEPEYSEYDLKKMREAKAEERRKKKAAAAGSLDKTTENAGDASMLTDKIDTSTVATTASDERPDDYDSRSKAAKKRARQKANKKTRQGATGVEGEAADATAGAPGEVAVPNIKVEDLASDAENYAAISTTEDVDKLAASVMPNIARLSMLVDSDDDDDQDEHDTPFASAVPSSMRRSISSATKASAASDLTVTRLDLSNKTASDNSSIRTTGSDVTVIRHDGSKPASASNTHADIHAAALEASATNSGSHSSSPVRFIRPPRPTNYENPSPTGTPELEHRPNLHHTSMDGQTFREQNASANDGKTTSNSGTLDSDGLVHPWPDLWPEYERKGPRLPEKQWPIVNACLGSLGMPEYGRIQPADPLNRAAYAKVVEVLKTSWMIMTGQITPEGSEVASQLLEPLLEKEKLAKQEKLERLQEKLKIQRKALQVSASSSSKHSSTSSELAASYTQSPMVSAGSPYPSFGDYFTNTPTSPAPSKRSSIASQHVQSPHDAHHSSASFSGTSGQPVQPSSARPSAHSSFDGHPGAQTPLKRGRVQSFTSVFSKTPKTPKTPKSPKLSAKSPKSHRTKDSIEELDQIVTTPLDAPPVPTIPATYGGKDTPHLSFDGALMSNKNTPQLAGTPVRKKKSMSFGDTPSFGNKSTPKHAGGTPSLGGRKTSMFFNDVLKSGKKKTPQVDHGTPMQPQMPTDEAQASSFSGPPASGTKTPPAEMYPSSSGPEKPAMLSVDTNFSSANAPDTHKHSRKRSTASSIATVDYDTFDTHIEELSRAFRAWDRDVSPTDLSTADGEANSASIKTLDTQKIQALSREALAKLDKSTLKKTIDADSLAAKYPRTKPAASTFPLAHLALRLSQHLLNHVNAQYLPLLDCEYEIYNAHLVTRERLWRFRHPDAVHYPGPGIARPTPEAYLEAGYLVAWCTRFVQWAQEQQQLWVYHNVDVPASRFPGGGLKRPGRTMEVRSLLNWTDERVSVDPETGEAEVSGEGGACSAEEVNQRFEALAENQEDAERWAACEKQVRKLAAYMTD